MNSFLPLDGVERISVIRPPGTYDLSALRNTAVEIVHTSFPETQSWQQAGYSVSQEIGETDAAIVVVPRSKHLGRAMIAAAARVARLVVVDGQKTDGVDSLFKAIRGVLGDIPSITQSHGRLFCFAQTDAFAPWASEGPVQNDHGWITQPGVFSQDAVDSGSALLAAALPDALPARMADLGAGWGYLSAAVLARAGVATLDLIEAEALALDCARRNITDPRARFVWGDATQAKGIYDGIVMNPPFHQGRTADVSLGRAFVIAAARQLSRSGQLWMVANRHLSYEDTLATHFKQVSELSGNRSFKLFHAARPRS